jgi:predicted nucleic acid-binding Zn ribbon protein
MTAHDAFCMLINLSDSLLTARRIGDADFLTFLVRYIADPVSLLADLACMLLSNLTKLESVGATLLSLRLSSRPFYSFMSSEDANAAMEAMEAEEDDPKYQEKKLKAERHNKRLKEIAERGEEEVPAMSKLLDAFEEGAEVGGGKSEAATIEEMRVRAREIQQQGEEDQDKGVQMGSDSRPVIKRKTNCNFLASVFANLTILPNGREYFVTPFSTSSAAASATAQAEAASVAASMQDGIVAPPAKEYPVARIMVFTEHPDLIRRGGVISCLKNIFFIKSAHKLLIAPPSVDSTTSQHRDELLAGALRATSRPPSSIDILPYLLLPLCDGQELSKLDMEDQEMLPEECQLLDEGKRREKDSVLRLMLVESLLLLCTGLYGRQCLRERGVYIVVREAHLQEKDEKIAEGVLRLVNILKRDESENSINEQGEGEDEINVDAEEVEEDEAAADDEDLRIEEL